MTSWRVQSCTEVHFDLTEFSILERTYYDLDCHMSIAFPAIPITALYPKIREVSRLLPLSDISPVTQRFIRF